MKITVDSTTNMIRATALTTGIGSITANLMIPVTIVATMPDGVTEISFIFNVVDSTCANNVFTDPGT